MQVCGESLHDSNFTRNGTDNIDHSFGGDLVYVKEGRERRVLDLGEMAIDSLCSPSVKVGADMVGERTRL